MADDLLDVATSEAVDKYEQTGGTLTGTGTLTVSDTLVWTGGVMQGSGRTVVGPDAKATLVGSGLTLSQGRTFQNDGTATWLAADISGGGTFLNGPSGILNGFGVLSGDLTDEGHLRPGAVPPPPPGGVGFAGVFTIHGVHTEGGTFDADLGGPSDQVEADRATLSGKLEPVAIDGFPLPSYTVVSVTGSGPAVGTFTDLPEGKVLTIRGVKYEITYTGGDGNDVVLHRLGSVAGSVWNDLNKNGVWYAPEPGLAGVGVRLDDEDGDEVGFTSTDSAGAYRFDDLIHGKYTLTFDLLAGFAFSAGGPTQEVDLPFAGSLTERDAGEYRLNRPPVVIDDSASMPTSTYSSTYTSPYRSTYSSAYSSSYTSTYDSSYTRTYQSSDTGTDLTPLTIAVLANDSDPDGDPLTVKGVGSAASGTVTINADWTVTYTPDSGTTASTDSFTYAISDGQGGTAWATVTITLQ